MKSTDERVQSILAKVQAAEQKKSTDSRKQKILFLVAPAAAALLILFAPMLIRLTTFPTADADGNTVVEAANPAATKFGQSAGTIQGNAPGKNEEGVVAEVSEDSAATGEVTTEDFSVTESKTIEQIHYETWSNPNHTVEVKYAPVSILPFESDGKLLQEHQADLYLRETADSLVITFSQNGYTYVLESADMSLQELLDFTQFYLD